MWTVLMSVYVDIKFLLLFSFALTYCLNFVRKGRHGKEKARTREREVTGQLGKKDKISKTIVLYKNHRGF